MKLNRKKTLENRFGKIPYADFQEIIADEY